MSTFILRRIFQKIGGAGNDSVRVTFADGSQYKNYSGDQSPNLSIRFKTRYAQWRTIIYLPVGFFDAYIDGSVDLEGDTPIARIARLGHAAGIQRDKGGLRRMLSRNPLVWLRDAWCELTQDNVSRERAIRNAEFHYALPAELFKYKLGNTLGYSEGYWVQGTETLDQAKHNLYEYICQKLQLKPGMKVLEVGSGWGYLPIYMVKKYDVDVVVYNPTKEQNDYMQRRFERHGVADRIRIEFGVHADIMKERSTFDRFVTIGVHEHHGIRKRMYRLWWKSIAHVLKDGGIGVISTSSYMDHRMTGYLTLRYIWPGGHIPSIPMEIAIMREEGLRLVELENLWTHYQRTVAIWRDRFKKFWPEIHAANPTVFDEQFRRRWIMYLEAVAQHFDDKLDCSHLIFVKGGDPDAYPRTLEGRYLNADFRKGGDVVECYA
ncbi:class I SAM-dependent methyltransferase [Candidatus Kaiserbacteria bacterium]|nr:class I SAM-dependent methyltransferase [Candidatus Kaiserbacteria bacterium]